MFKGKNASDGSRKKRRNMRRAIIAAVVGALGYGIHKLTEPDFMMPTVINNLDQPLVPYIAQALYFFMMVPGWGLDMREAMTIDNGVTKLVNYVNGEGATEESHKIGMSLLSLLAEYEPTRPFLRHAIVFRTAAHHLKSEDVEIKGAALNVLLYMFKDKESAQLVVDSQVFKDVCTIAQKAFEKDDPEQLAGELALQAISKIPHYYPGGMRKLRKTPGFGNDEMNIIYAAVNNDMMMHSRSGDHEEQLKCLQVLIDIQPIPDFFQMRARVLLSMGDSEGAIWNMRRAIKAGTKEAKEHTFLAQILLESGLRKNVEEARRMIAKMLANEPPPPKDEEVKPVKVEKMEEEEDLSGFDMKRGSMGGADDEPERKQVFGRDPDYYMRMETQFSLLCKADIMLRDYRSAARHVDDWLELVPDSAVAHYTKAKVLTHNGDHKNALKEINLSLASNPHRAEVQYQRAHILYKMKENDKAFIACKMVVNELRRTGTSSKYVPNLHLLMGKLNELKEDYVEAEKCYARLAKINLMRPMPHYRRARVLAKLGKEEEANKVLGTVLDIWTEGCIESKQCKNYFYYNTAATNALNFIKERCNGVSCEAAPMPTAVPMAVEEDAESEDEVPPPPKQVAVPEKMAAGDMCALYKRLIALP